jgi:hypothetical protein
MASLKRRKRNWPLRLFFVFLVLLVALGVAARLQLALVPPHVASAPAARLSPEKKKQLDDLVDEQVPTNRDEAIELALDFTGKSLSLSPGHPTSFDFGIKPQGANCAEYASLFVAAFDAAAKRVGSSALGYRVHSDVRVFGKRIPVAAFADAGHDWVMVVDPADGARIYVDPVFADLWLGASLARNVKGGDGIDVPR